MCHKSKKFPPRAVLAIDDIPTMVTRSPVMRILTILSAAVFLAHPLRGQGWPPVPAADFSQIQLSQFADHELEVPYHLRHFAQVANAVVENPFTDSTGTYLPRGFLNIKVNREPADNKPYNARIMEMQAALAYFYTADRPWNPYRGSSAVRVRLEAMLQRWTEMQAPPGHSFAGLFTEYSSSNWSLAPTGFGVRHAAEAIDLIVDSGLHFDASILENSRISLRRALMAVFTRSDMRNAAKLYSNQFSAAYHAALIYLENWPDAELDSAFVSAVNAAAAQDQSPAGYWYEQGGPDFGYTNVHDSNMRIALPRMRNRADLMPVATADDSEWNEWLAAQLVLQPGLATRTFFINGGINTRTSDSTRVPNSRLWSEFAETSRVFSLTDTEFATATAARRSQVQSQFGNWGALAVPSSSSYIPSFVHDAVTPLNVWHPSAAQRDAAQAGMACLSPVSLNRLYRDPFPTSFTIAKRPQYFAAVTTGNIRVSRQVYGLGLLWNPSFGVALQSVAGNTSSNNWLYGTRRSGTSATYETANIPTTITAGDTAVNQTGGITTLPQGDLTFSYPLAASGTTYGQKTITLGGSRVDVSLAHSGSFTEMLPLAHADDAVLANTGGKLTLTRPNGSSFTIEVTTPGAVISTGTTGGIVSGMTRRAVTISASESLSYSLTVSDSNPSPPETTSPGKASTPPGTPVDIDLRAFVSDRQTPDDNFFFTLGPAAGGNVILLDDGFTARFTPAENFEGAPSFAYSVRDQGNDPRLIRHYRFELPDATTDGLATDASASAANGELSTSGTGSATYQDDAPPPFPSGENRSLRLTGPDAANFARLRTAVSTATRDLSNQDWTTSFWFKRATGNTHDFLFYIGSGNGFSGEGHELEIFAPANANTLRMQYWDGANVKQADLTSDPVVSAGQWHHAAAVWQASGGGQGTLTLYLNGQPAGGASFSAAFKQTSPLVFGGTQTSAPDPRHLDGWLDDVALYATALDAGEIASLATQPVANHAGLESDGLLEISIDPLSGGLGGHWTFEDDMVDVSGRAWEMLPTTGAGITTARGKQGGSSLALPLDGDYVASAVPIPLGDAFTLASWVYLPSGENSIRTIAANSPSGFNANGFRFFVNRFNTANAELVLETGNGSQATLIVSPAGTVASDRWQHVAAVVDSAGGQATLYVNGAPVASGEVRTDFNHNSVLALGAMVGGLHGLRGNIDDFRIYSRLLDAAELTTVFAAANEPPVVTPPVALTMAAGTASDPLAVTLDDMESGPAALVLTAASSDPALLPPENIILGGEGANRTVILNPVAWRGGVATITLTASDGVSSASNEFEVTVTNNGYPALWTATTPGAPLAWSTADHWSMSIPPFPGAACDLDFLSGTEAPGGIIHAGQDIAMPFTARSLRLGGSGAATLRIGGPSLALVANGPGTPSIALDATGVMTHEVETPIQLSNNATVTGNGDASFVFRSEISGTGGLVKTGSSSLVLAGANTFGGAVSIQSGVLRATHHSALGGTAGSTLVQGGTALATLELADGITSAEPIQLVMQNTPGHTHIRNVSGDNTLSGQLSLNGGGARWDITSAAGWLHVAGHVSNIANPVNPDIWRKLHLTGPAGGSFSGTMTDAAKSKLNLAILSGEWHLTGSAKDYTGTTEVAAGTLVVETALQSNVIVNPAAVLRGQGGSTSASLELKNDAVIAIALSPWDSPPAPFTAGQLQITRAIIRIDAPQPAGFTETPRSFPLIHVPSGIGSIDPSLLAIDASGLPGTGRWSVVQDATTLSLAYQPDLYLAWAAGIDWQGADPSLTADAENDGITNLMEYALGGNPLRSDPSILPDARLDTGTLVLSFLRTADPDLLYEVRAGSDLTALPDTWQTIWSSTGAANLRGLVEVADTPPSPAPPARFLRLRVSRHGLAPPQP
jgi:autotransporter-associated beta strand protein